MDILTVDCQTKSTDIREAAPVDADRAAAIRRHGEQRDLNRQTIQDQARNALAANATFLAIVSPTNAQAVAQTKALTRQMNGVIRLLLGALDAVE